MRRIFVPTRGLDDWRERLAQPHKHWRDGYSAKELARRWESAHGFPQEIAELFAASEVPGFQHMELLAAFPEHRVVLEGRGRASQTDLLVLARSDSGLLVAAIEAKVGESFGPALGKWLEGAAANRMRRLRFLKETLGLTGRIPGTIRYQLLHRTASAVLEARRFHAPAAAMIVHSFAAGDDGSADWEAFVGIFGAHASVGCLVRLGRTGDVELFAGWAKGTSTAP